MVRGALNAVYNFFSILPLAPETALCMCACVCVFCSILRRSRLRSIDMLRRPPPFF